MSRLLNFIFRTSRIALLNIKSNKEVCLISIATITIAFSILGLFLLILVNLESFLSSWDRQVQLVVYLEDDISKENQGILEKLVAENPNVEASAYVSRDKAWEKFKKTFSGKAEIIDSLEFNPLPASLNLQFKSFPDRLEAIRQFAALLEKKPGVESLEYGEQWISRFEAFMVFARMFLFAVGGLLSLGLILIVSNTIKLSIYSQRDEIELMLLVGARPQFIKIPFLLEGTVQGGMGALISIGILKCIHLYMKFQFDETIGSILTGLDIQFVSPFHVALIVFSSMFIGCLGSLISISQFLASEAKR